MNKIPIFEEKDLNSLLKQALKNDGVLTTPTEISQMLVNIKGVSINSTPRKDGRFQGYVLKDSRKVYVYGKSKNEVAFKLKEYLKNGLPEKRKKADALNGVPTTFNNFAIYYFDTFRKRKVSEETLRADLSRYNKYLLPYFNEKPLKKISPKDCQFLLDSISQQGKGKTADEIYSLLSIIFKNAIKHSILSKNPLDVIYHEKHEREHGKALTPQQEAYFKGKIAILTDENTKQGLFLMLYTGLRPNELLTAKIENGFIVAKNSKRKNKKVEYKKIPIIKALLPYVKDGLYTYNLNKLRATIKTVLPNNKLYDLRTTFYSKCKEYGVSEPARDYFVGHSLGEIGNAYTDLSDEYLIKEAKKLDKWL